MKAQESLYANITLNDIQLATVYYPILVDLARNNQTLSYGELVVRAKRENPDNPAVQNAIAVSVGRKLDVIRLFVGERELPDLTSLIVSKQTGECGSLFTSNFDPVTARQKVFAFDWSDVSDDFSGYIGRAGTLTKKNSKVKAVAKSKSRINRAEALALMSSYYKEHKESLPSDIPLKRDIIILLLMDGYSCEEAFSKVY